ncbi:ribonuclease H family protein, partial [Klebsiella pneumoniae]|uniref:ribonuclease H family protein n=1 Tax=Klebsiella pneumoniae TaxID=573 RepID=UPI004055822C
TEEATSSYNHLKNELISDRVLTPYDPNLPLILATDASPVGLGAVLSHIMPDASDRARVVPVELRNLFDIHGRILSSRTYLEP